MTELAPTATPTATPNATLIATRESRLALWQAEHVRDLLKQRFGGTNQRPGGTSREQSRACTTFCQKSPRSAPLPGKRPAIPTIATRSVVGMG